MKKLILLAFILLLLPMVSADWLADGSCETKTDCLISKLVINDTSAVTLPSAVCNLTISFPNGTSDGTFLMINNSNGYHNYTINYEPLGLYPTSMLCTWENSTDTADISFIIGIVDNYNNWLYLLLLLIPIFLLWLGRKEDEPAYVMLAGFVLMAFAIAMYANAFPNFNFNENLTTKGFTLFVLGVGMYITGRTILDYMKKGVN